MSLETFQQIVNGLLLGGVLAFVAVAFTLTIGVLNFLNFTIPALFMIAGMVSWALASPGSHWLGFRWPWPAAIVAGALVAAFASIVVERCTYRYFKVRFGDATEHALPLVSSLGFLIIFENMALLLWGSDPQRMELPLSDANVHWAGLVIGVPPLISLVMAFGMVFAITVLIKRTRIGRALRAISENPDAAGLMGIEVQRIVPVVFMVSGLLAALAGILYGASYGTVSPYMGDTVATDAIAAMVIGGLGNIWGAVAGGLLVGMIKVLSISLLGAEVEKIPVWGVLLLVLVLRPAGLLGRAHISKRKV